MLTFDMATLASANAARRCAVCGGADVCVTCPGSDAVWVEQIIELTDGSTRRHRCLLTSSTPDVDLCLADAAARWPWRSHKQRGIADA